MKKVLTLILSVLMMFTTIQLYVSAKDSLGGSCGENVVWSLNKSSGELVISGTGAMDSAIYEYLAVNEPSWWETRDLIKSIVIKNGITHISKSAFAACSNATKVSIPNTVITIGHSAFFEMNSLTNIIIPDGVKAIEDSAFEDCVKLENITIGKGVKTIGNAVFRNCKSLKTVSIPDNVTYLGWDVFRLCDNLTSVEIGSGITNISRGMFYGCTNLKEVQIDKKVASIEWDSFNNCSNLTDVYYNGMEAEWNKIEIGEYNEPLKNATIHFANETSIKLGDVNFDTKINSTDALMCLQHSVGKSLIKGKEFTAGDVDKNGTINSSDALLILQFSVGKIKQF